VSDRTLVLGTRGSALAHTQSRWFRDELLRRSPGLTVELLTIKTQGDRIVDRPLAQVPGKGFFVKEIQKALIDGEIDLAVHSLKDLPVESTPGLILGCVPGRESPADTLVTPDGGSLATLPAGAVVGTSSARRRQQIAHGRPDLKFIDLRGNVDPRLAKLSRGECQAIVLARAGLNRLGLTQVKGVDLPFDVMLPAVGQGALGIEIREDDSRAFGLVRLLEDGPTRIAVLAERAFLAALGGGCSAPIGALAIVDGRTIVIDGVVCDPRSDTLLRDRIRGEIDRAEVLALNLAGRLIERGAGRFL
jgi:hydroxymethylbilane synthase